MIAWLLRRLGVGGDAGSVASKDIVGKWGPFSRFTITGADGTPYLTRYYLLKTGPFSIYLHRFHRSDEDRALHDHPRPFVSFLFPGPGYVEEQPDGTTKRFRGLSVNARLEPGKPHRVEVKPGKEQWSIVFLGRAQREWGFHVLVEDLEDIPPEAVSSKYVAGAIWVPWFRFMDLKFGRGRWEPAKVA